MQVFHSLIVAIDRMCGSGNIVLSTPQPKGPGTLTLDLRSSATVTACTDLQATFLAFESGRTEPSWAIHVTTKPFLGAGGQSFDLRIFDGRLFVVGGRVGGDVRRLKEDHARVVCAGANERLPLAEWLLTPGVRDVTFQRQIL